MGEEEACLNQKLEEKIFIFCVNSVLSSGPNLRVGPSLLSTGEDGLGDNIYGRDWCKDSINIPPCTPASFTSSDKSSAALPVHLYEDFNPSRR